MRRARSTHIEAVVRGVRWIRLLHHGLVHHCKPRHRHSSTVGVRQVRRYGYGCYSVSRLHVVDARPGQRHGQHVVQRICNIRALVLMAAERGFR